MTTKGKHGKKINPKLEKAIILLRQGNSCGTVAQMVGYHPVSFQLAFKRYFGETPGKHVAPNLTLKKVDKSKIDLFVNAHLHSGIDETAVASFMNISRQDLQALFLEQEGISLSNYIDEKRMGCITDYLNEGYEAQVISKLMNFVSVGAFESFFRRNIGYSISVYRKRVLGKVQEATSNSEVKCELELIQDYIKENLKIPNLPISIKKKFRSPIWLIDKRFGEVLNTSLDDYILKERMRLAKALLIDKKRVEVIAEETGFHSVSELAVSYRQYYKDESNIIFNQAELKASKDMFELLHRYLLDHLASRITINGIASFFQVPREKVVEVINQNTHLNFLTYVRFLRIEVAKEYLQAGVELPEIASKVGYSSLLSFEQAFRQVDKISTEQYLRRVNSGDFSKSVQVRKYLS